MREFNIGDFVRVASGPAYVKGQPIRGRIVSVDREASSAIVRVNSGGEWGFMLADLVKLSK